MLHLVLLLLATFYPFYPIKIFPCQDFSPFSQLPNGGTEKVAIKVIYLDFKLKQ
jgi:hypothetical protein